VLLELSPAAEQQAPAGLVRYHAAIEALVGRADGEHRTAIRAFLQEAADAASRAAADMDGDRAG